jgi:hypothetical protein
VATKLQCITLEDRFQCSPQYRTTRTNNYFTEYFKIARRNVLKIFASQRNDKYDANNTRHLIWLVDSISMYWSIMQRKIWPENLKFSCEIWNFHCGCGSLMQCSPRICEGLVWIPSTEKKKRNTAHSDRLFLTFSQQSHQCICFIITFRSIGNFQVI